MPENNNCLAGMKCPKCEALEPFAINAQTNVLMFDEGSESHGDLEWDDDSRCECLSCHFAGQVAVFKTATPTQAATPAEDEPISLRQDSPNEYTLTESSVWITVKKMSVYVRKTDEGVVVDIYKLGDEAAGGEALGSTYVFDSEAENEEEA